MNRKPLSNLAKIISGGTPKRSIHEYWNGSIPWISVKDLHQGKHNYKTERFITESGLKNSSTNLLIQDDIVISARGTVGLVSMITEPMAFNQSIFGLRSGEEITAEYLYYWLKLNVSYIQNNVHGSVFDTITRDTFDIIEVTYPSLEEQKKVTEILRLLDEKIEQNHQINDNLLKLGRTEFKNITSAATTKKLQDIATIVMGQSPKSDTYNNEDIGLPLLNGAADFKGRVVSPNKWTSDPKKVTEPGDYVFGVRATLGLTTKVFEEYAIGRGTGVARAKSKILDEYLYFVLDDMFDFFEATATGSVYLNVSANDFKNYQAPVVSDAVWEKFHKFARPIMEQFYTNKAEIISLAQIRDVLLGKLVHLDA